MKPEHYISKILTLDSQYKLFGRTSKATPGFYQTERIGEDANERDLIESNMRAFGDAAGLNYIAKKESEYSGNVTSIYEATLGFLLLTNSGAIVAAVAVLGKAKGWSAIFAISAVVLFFLSVALIGASRWALILWFHFLRGTLYKNRVRFLAGRISYFELLRREYEAQHGQTWAGALAFVSFVFLLFGWGSLLISFLLEVVRSEPVANEGHSIGAALIGHLVSSLF